MRSIAAPSVLVLALAAALAACGGATPSAERLPTTVPASSATAAPSPEPSAAAIASPAPSLDLPDLSGIESDLTAIDAALAADSAAPAAEGSFK